MEVGIYVSIGPLYPLLVVRSDERWRVPPNDATYLQIDLLSVIILFTFSRLQMFLTAHRQEAPNTKN
jgi:hypothetical protein